MIKIYFYEAIQIETQINLFRIFGEKKCVRAEISIPHFATIKNRITENKTLYSCHIVFIPRQNFQVFN